MDNGFLISMQVFVPNPLVLTIFCIIFAGKLAINKTNDYNDINT